MDDLLRGIIALIIALAYLGWAIHAGNKVLTGRFEWLDKDATPNKVCKFILAFTIGSFISGLGNNETDNSEQQMKVASRGRGRRKRGSRPFFMFFGAAYASYANRSTVQSRMTPE